MDVDTAPRNLCLQPTTIRCQAALPLLYCAFEHCSTYERCQAQAEPASTADPMLSVPVSTASPVLHLHLWAPLTPGNTMKGTHKHSWPHAAPVRAAILMRLPAALAVTPKHQVLAQQLGCCWSLRAEVLHDGHRVPASGRLLLFRCTRFCPPSRIVQSQSFHVMQSACRAQQLAGSSC